MNKDIYPCTAADPMGSGPQPGLLGSGSLPWPSEVAARTFPSMLDIGGAYAVDDLSAAEFLIAELSAPESELDEQETEHYVLLLHAVLSRLKQAGNVSSEQLLSLKKKAESIPVVGPLLFSNANLPGTLASVSGVVHAASKATKVEELLDLSDATRKQLKRWIATRGKAGSVSARRAFRGRIKVMQKQGKIFFEIPSTAKAKMYRVAGEAVSDFIHVPVHGTAKAMQATAHMDSTLYGQRGIGKLLVGGKASAALAFIPQLIIDGHDATSVEDFLKRSAYSQPTNGLAFASGVIVGAALGSVTAVVAIPVGLAVGLMVQIFMSDDVSGFGNDLGNFLTGKE